MDYIVVLDDDSLNSEKSPLPAEDSSVIPTNRIQNLVQHRYSLHRSIKINIADEFRSSTSSKGQRNSAHDQPVNSTLLNHSMNESDVQCKKPASTKGQNFVTDPPLCNTCNKKFHGYLDLNEHLPQCIQFRRELCHVKNAVNFSDAMIQTDNICLRETETQTVTKFQVGNKRIEKRMVHSKKY
ncbi:unnamed protein product [Allacma fusca]|uniref:Uncharacterized protein n=1 Tax=Allacma fusca TaxID=39272 RepID=A0A8J2LP03_9HEXA|nr:unnamed protein product [Allacma fusca]